jgi:hypothetical protein
MDGEWPVFVAARSLAATASGKFSATALSVLNALRQLPNISTPWLGVFLRCHVGRDFDPVPGQWYEDLEEEAVFRVLSVDPDEELVQIQHEDGEIEEFDLDVWHELDLDKASEPEGWSGSADDDDDEDDDWDEDEDEDEDDDWDEDEDEDEDDDE